MTNDHKIHRWLIENNHIAVNPDGTPIVRRPNDAQVRDRLSLPDAIANIRGTLIPPGYTPWPFRRDTPESMLDMLRSVVATYEFRKTVKSFFEEFGADFTQHLYVPEIDPVTGTPHHERGDHNHVLKRVAACTRNGNYPDLNFEAFVEAMRSPNTGLTYTALAGKRKQSVVDAERLLSYHVANFFREKGYENEYQYVKVIAQWHESSDGNLETNGSPPNEVLACSHGLLGFCFQHGGLSQSPRTASGSLFQDYPRYLQNNEARRCHGLRCPRK